MVAKQLHRIATLIKNLPIQPRLNSIATIAEIQPAASSTMRQITTLRLSTVYSAIGASATAVCSFLGWIGAFVMRVTVLFVQNALTTVFATIVTIWFVENAVKERIFAKYAPRTGVKTAPLRRLLRVVIVGTRRLCAIIARAVTCCVPIVGHQMLSILRNRWCVRTS